MKKSWRMKIRRDGEMGISKASKALGKFQSWSPPILPIPRSEDSGQDCEA